MDDLLPIVEKLPHARTRCTFTIADAERSVLEQRVLENMAKTSQARGFRAGRVPIGIVKEQTKPETLTEEIVHAFLRERLPKLLKEQTLTPIIHPRIECTSRTPITLVVTIVEKPSVTLRGKDALRIAKKDIHVTDEDVTSALDALKKEHALAEWTDAAVQKQWGIPSIEKLRTSIADALKRQKEHAEQERREEAFFAQVQKSTDVDLASELLESEEQHMLDSLQEGLHAQNLSFAEWLKRTGKGEEAFRKDMRAEAERRLRLRFGIDTLLQEHQIAASDGGATEERDETAEHRRWQSRLQKLLALFLN